MLGDYIYKGFSLTKKAEEYLASHGLKEAPYSISATDVHEGLFGRLVACLYEVRGTLYSCSCCSLIVP